jgi:myo-inositol-hexaphosphate 3-phosphohydrolase
MSNGVYQTSTLAPGKSYVMYTRDGENRLVSTTIEVLQDWANQEIDFIWEMEIEEYSGCR